VNKSMKIVQVYFKPWNHIWFYSGNLLLYIIVAYYFFAFLIKDKKCIYTALIIKVIPKNKSKVQSTDYQSDKIPTDYN